MNYQPSRHQQQTGFTILELLIATTVLSVILLMSTVMMVNIGRLYYKGINQARIQDNTRSITEEISQRLQLTSDQPPLSDSSGGSVHAYCMGATRYTYILNTQIGPDPSQSPQVLWRDTTVPGTCPVADLTAVTQGVELIAPKSRLTAFSIACATPTSPCTITVGVAYGDGPNGDLLNLNGVNTTCRDTVGNQFCAAANLKTTVVRRLE